jgi:hypothetical protein
LVLNFLEDEWQVATKALERTKNLSASVASNQTKK